MECDKEGATKMKNKQMKKESRATKGLEIRRINTTECVSPA